MELARGDVVGIPFKGVRHEGLVVEPGDEDSARVVHASKRRGVVTEDSAREFRARRPISVVARARNPEASAAYARSLIGRPWRYWSNCQTFTRETVGRSLRSPDADRAALGAAVLLGTFLAVRALTH